MIQVRINSAVNGGGTIYHMPLLMIPATSFTSGCCYQVGARDLTLILWQKTTLLYHAHKKAQLEY